MRWTLRRDSASPRVQWWLIIARIALALAALAIASIPIFRFPIVADDLQSLAEALRYFESHGTMLGVFADPGDALFGQARSLPASRALQPFFWDAVIRVPSMLDLPIGWGLKASRVVAIVVAVATAAAAATTWRLTPRRLSASAVGRLGSPIRGWCGAFSMWFLGLGVIVATTIQVHGLWSNDPVVSYGLTSWLTAVVIFGVIALIRPALRTGGRRRWFPVSAVALAGLLGVWFYELVVPALVVIGIGLATLLVLSLTGRWRTDSPRRLALVLVAASGVPLAGFVILRFVGAGAGVSGDTSYGGTQLAINAAAVKTWFGGLGSSLPGAAWPLSSDFGAGALDRWFLLGAAGMAVISAVAVWLVRVGWRSQHGDHGSLAGDRWFVGSVLLGSAAATTALHAATAKYQTDLAGQLGDVYLFYAVSFLVVAIGITWGWLGLMALSNVRWAYVGALVIALVAGYQLSVNASLAHTANATAYPVNVGLLAAFDEDRRSAAANRFRCAKLDEFSAYPWPDYYRDAVRSSIEDAFRDRFGAPMCVDAATRASP